jgi:hypothetical protein
MAEEDSNDTTITNDDLNVLRVLLHNVKGLSTVSSAPYVAQEDTTEE